MHRSHLKGLWSQLHLQFIFCSSNFCCSVNICSRASWSSLSCSSLKPISSASTSFSLASKSINPCLQKHNRGNIPVSYKLSKAFSSIINSTHAVTNGFFSNIPDIIMQINQIRLIMHTCTHSLVSMLHWMCSLASKVIFYNRHTSSKKINFGIQAWMPTITNSKFYLKHTIFRYCNVSSLVARSILSPIETHKKYILLND